MTKVISEDNFSPLHIAIKEAAAEVAAYDAENPQPCSKTDALLMNHVESDIKKSAQDLGVPEEQTADFVRSLRRIRHVAEAHRIIMQLQANDETTSAGGAVAS